ncbi:hypothetical protein [Clostridium gasigenes]|uniref:Uncharacterized protein n=1 Tax=Clostridium gasigenes TaxID=94869 RepID=A0A1H0S2J5_9CLOT|nr:hypothetical protein [Clostridium gasigenes]SDP35953.1 hypothetical protein SAMN04488529_104132 [Clostridium gasigenes]
MLDLIKETKKYQIYEREGFLIKIPKVYDGYCYANNSYSDFNQFSTLVIESKENGKKSSQRYYQADNEIIERLDNDIDLLNEGNIRDLHFKRAFLSILYDNNQRYNFINNNNEVVEGIFLGKNSFNNDFYIKVDNEKCIINNYKSEV